MAARTWIAPLSAALAGLMVGAPTAATRSAASNERAARRDAAAHLAGIRLPAGARPSSTEPRGDGGALKSLGALAATSARAGAHAWWTSRQGPDAVLGYIESHPPASSRQSGTASVCSRTCTRSVMYAWPAIPGVIGARMLWVTVAGLSGGGSGVLASAESDWIVPRPASETIPAGVRQIEITSRRVDSPLTSSLTVTDPRRVRRIVSLFDAMPIVQPGVIACPALMIGGATRRITFAFRAQAGGPALAGAAYIDYAPYMKSSGACNPVSFTIRGRRQDPLVGGGFLGRVEAILGTDVAR